MKKRILAAASAAVMLISSTAFADSNTENKAPEYTFNKQLCEEHEVQQMPQFSDVKEISNELDLIIRLNIMSGYEDGTLKPDRTVTRAEAAKILCYTINNKTGVQDIEQQYSKEGFEETKEIYAESGVEYEFEYNGFSDVSLESWYHPYVYEAMGYYISGYEDGTFRPENQVTEIEFLTMLERALGYSDMLEAEGGYPDGVIAISNRLNLIDNPTDTPATRERAAAMLYNALHSYVVTVERWNLNAENNTTEKIFTQTRTLMDIKDLYKIHGTLKKSSVLPEKTVVFVPDEDFNHRSFASLDKGKEYTFAVEYSDIPEGEYDVYIDACYDELPTIVAAE